jgi:hypothetical protein
MALTELKINEFYTCRLSGLPVQILSIDTKLSKKIEVRGNYFNPISGYYATANIADYQLVPLTTIAN